MYGEKLTPPQIQGQGRHQDSWLFCRFQAILRPVQEGGTLLEAGIDLYAQAGRWFCKQVIRWTFKEFQLAIYISINGLTNRPMRHTNMTKFERNKVLKYRALHPLPD